MTDCILDVRVTNLDAATYFNRDPDKVLLLQEKQKRTKYSKACTEQRRDLSPFVVSTDEMIGKSVKKILRSLAQILAEKWDSPYSNVCGFVNSRMGISIARATNRCIRGARTPSCRMSIPTPHWEDGAGLKLFCAGH